MISLQRYRHWRPCFAQALIIAWALWAITDLVLHGLPPVGR